MNSSVTITDLRYTLNNLNDKTLSDLYKTLFEPDTDRPWSTWGNHIAPMNNHIFYISKMDNLNLTFRTK